MVTQPAAKGDRAVEEILDAARRLFLQNGYNGTSMRAIAREAGGRSVAGLYNHFKDKQAIFRALIERYNPYDDLFNILNDATVTTGPDLLASALQAMMLEIANHYEYIQLVMIDLRELQGETMNAYIPTILPRAFEVIQRIQSTTGMTDTDIRPILRFFVSVVIGFVLTQKLNPAGMFDEWSHEAWAAKFADMAIYGISGKDTHS